MTIHVDACPSCGASLRIPLGQARFTCPYCSASISIDLSDGEVNLAVADAINATATATQAVIQQGTAVTQTEMRRMQLTQQLSQMEMQLSNVRAEMRAIERAERTSVSRRQLLGLASEEVELMGSIHDIRTVLYPPLVVATSLTKAPATSLSHTSSSGIGWLLFSFRGTATVGQFWTAVGLGFLGSVVFSMISAVFGLSSDNPLVGLFGLAFLWVYLAVGTKRYRDLGKSPIWLAVGLIPIIGFFWQLFELGFRSCRE